MEKIKILFVNHKLFWGGAERALFDLINLMDKDKFDVSLFVQHDDGVWDGKFRDAGIRIIYDYSCRKPTFNPIKKLGNLSKKLKVQKAYQQGGQGLLETCVPEGADIVVSYSVWENEELVFLPGAKTVKYYHGDPGTDPIYREEVLKTTDKLNRFDRVICVSQAACNAFRELTGLQEKVQMCFNPMDSDVVKKLSLEAVDFPTDAPVICAVGRLADDKGFERLIYVHKNLLKQGIYHKLLIVGDGPDRVRVENTIRVTQTQDTVILAGFQSNPYPYMAKAKFLVCPSYAEGMPVISMEALCLGTPIVSAVPSIGEAFGDEVCGIVTENDNDSLEEGIRRMLTDEDFYTKAKEGAIRRGAFFDGKRMAKEVEDMFLALLKE